MSIQKYLSQLKGVKEQVKLLQKTATNMQRNKEALNSMLTIQQLSFKYIYKQQPSAVDLLSFLSFFNLQSILDFIARYYINNKNKEQGNLLERQANYKNNNFKEDVAFLYAFSLVDIKQRKNKFKMHRLIQLATGVQLKLTNRDRVQRWAFIQVIAQEFPNGKYVNQLRY